MVEQTTLKSGRRRFHRPDGWSLGASVIALIVLIPLVSVLWIAFFPTENIWGHLVATTLPRYLRNSLVLMASVGLLSAIIGTTCAWFVEMTRFPLQKFLQWALLMPLAIPAYIGAYALVDFLEYAGPLQTALRSFFGWETSRDYWFPEIRSMGSAIFVLSMAMYPYIYLLARTAFRDQTASVLEVSRALGCGPWSSFFRVALPLARPAIAAGAAIAMMESLADFGTVDFFAVQTLTTGIFTTWLQGYNAGGAAQIACVILSLVFVLAAFEKISRKRRRYHSLSSKQAPHSIKQLRGIRGWLVTIVCGLPFLAGFVLPISVILSHALDHPGNWLDADLWSATLNTILLSGVAAVLTVAGAVFLVYGIRQSRSRLPRLLMPLTTIGYAAPGAVLAIGLLFPLAAFDIALADMVEAVFNVDIGLLLTGSAAAIVFAYFVRFFAIAQNAVDSALGRVTPSMDMASRSLGRTLGQTLQEVHLPLIRGSVLVAGLLIFVDAAKELPATLILRPFNFETLATRVYSEAALENLGQAAPAAIFVTLVGLLPVILLVRNTKSR